MRRLFAAAARGLAAAARGAGKAAAKVGKAVGRGVARLGLKAGRGFGRGVKRAARRVAANHAHNAQQLPGQLKAMGREAMNDIRATLMEAYTGAPERAPAMGVPTAPTPGQVDREMRRGGMSMDR